MSYLKDVSIHERAPPVKIYKRALILIVIISYFHIHLYILFIVLMDIFIFQVFWIFT
jgi:hypothetical protein